MREAVYAQVDRLLEVLPAAPRGDARFGRALEAAFALRAASARRPGRRSRRTARRSSRSVSSSAPRGSPGRSAELDAGGARRREAAREGTTVRRRDDWVRHFTVSGALTVISAVAPSNAAGLLKEELDADGGSGFSFGDLLADRAGTTFADVATRDEASATAQQAR